MTAANQITFATPQRKINERSSMSVVARFRDRATNADVTPTTVDYRLDTEDGCEILGWTTATPGTSATLTLTSTQNEIRNCTRALEAKLLTVAADRGLSSEYRDTMRYEVLNRAYSS